MVLNKIIIAQNAAAQNDHRNPQTMMTFKNKKVDINSLSIEEIDEKIEKLKTATPVRTIKTAKERIGKKKEKKISETEYDELKRQLKELKY